MKLTFRLNGQDREIEAPGDRRVVELFREDLGLTGVKEACGAGECGACTILVDGVSRLSCLMLAGQLAGREITTVEGLAGQDRLHPLQQAFVDNGAVQCGFCTPGMEMAALDLLQRNPDPDRPAVRQGLSGNLCRCTGYQRIIDAVQDAAARLDGEEETS